MIILCILLTYIIYQLSIFMTSGAFFFILNFSKTSNFLACSYVLMSGHIIIYVKYGVPVSVN